MAINQLTQGYKGSNIARNVNFAHTVRMFFKRTGTTEWLDLGSLSDASSTPGVENFEYESNHDGKNAIAKRIAGKKSLAYTMTLDEINPDNLRLAFFLGSFSTGSILLPATATPPRVGNTFTLPETPATILSVRSEDGAELFTLTSDYTISGAVITLVASGDIDEYAPNQGDRINVTYTVSFAGGNTGARKATLLAQSTIEGEAMFQIRNSEGGLAQIHHLPLVTISPNGDVAFAADNIQQLPITVSASISNGIFGTLYVKNI